MHGIPGWRLVFASVAVVSAVIGLLNLAFARDPNYATAAGEKAERTAPPGGGLGEVGRQIWAVLTIPTFLIIVLQASACAPADAFFAISWLCSPSD